MCNIRLHKVEVLAPKIAYPLLTLPVCVLIAVNLIMHYYYCITVRPGFVNADREGLFAPSKEREVNSILWATRKGSKGKGKDGRLLMVTPAEYTTCLKCNMHRPEVRTI